MSQKDGSLAPAPPPPFIPTFSETAAIAGWEGLHERALVEACPSKVGYLPTGRSVALARGASHCC